MSLDRYGQTRRQPPKSLRERYGNRLRAPSRPDEAQAVAVVDLFGCGDPTHTCCGGRLLLLQGGKEERLWP